MWREYFNRKAAHHAGAIASSDYFSARSFLDQRRSVLDWVGPCEGRRILDAGCGVGAFSEPLVERNRVFGVDFSEVALGYARRRGLQAACADLARLPFPRGSFDLVLCIGVLQLIEDDRAVLAELTAMLAPEITLVVQTLNRESLQRKILTLSCAKRRVSVRSRAARRILAVGLGDVDSTAYYPLPAATISATPGLLARSLSTSFAVRGRRLACVRSEALVISSNG